MAIVWSAERGEGWDSPIVPQSKEVFFGTIDFPDPTEPSLAGFMVAETRQDYDGIYRQENGFWRRSRNSEVCPNLVT